MIVIGTREIIIVVVLLLIFLLIHFYLMPSASIQMVPVKVNKQQPAMRPSPSQEYRREYRPEQYGKMELNEDEMNRALMDPSRMVEQNPYEEEDVDYNALKHRFGVDFAPPFEEKKNVVPSGVGGDDVDAHIGTMSDGELVDRKILYAGLMPNAMDSGHINQE
jgi:hypothetical protein